MDLSSFECKRCGACCKWEGPVRVSFEEIQAIAEFLRLDPQEFIRTRTILAPDRKSLSLTENPDGSCAYYDDGRKICIINPVKPKQCSAFPFDWNFPGWDDLCAGGIALKNKTF